MKYEPISHIKVKIKWAGCLNQFNYLLSQVLLLAEQLTPMENKNFRKLCIHYFLLYEFRKTYTATEAMENIYDGYLDVVKAYTCQV